MFWRKLFKKKEKPFDFGNIEIKFDVKTICYFESITKKSFFKFEDEDVPYLIYASLLMNNEHFNITYNAFLFLLENPNIANWVVSKYKDIMDITGQFGHIDNSDEEKAEAINSKLTMTDIATSLIIDYGLDAEYVMHKMGLWEIEPFYHAAETKEHRRLEEERLFTYLTIMPHVDGKKLKGPEKLLPFEWEKGRDIHKERAEQKMERDKAYIEWFIKGCEENNEKTIEEDGTRGLDTSIE